MSNSAPRSLNLRIASLDPDTPKAKKDCKTCNRRRIRCDRSLPTCQKCSIRDLECPGYDLKLKWDQGVASRGRLAGKALPIFETGTGSQTSKFKSTTVKEEDTGSSAPLPAIPGIKYEIVDQRGNSYDALHVEPAVPRRDARAPASATAIVVRNGSIPMSLSMHPELPSRNMLEYVHHYDNQLAATLVWVDGTDNPWRTVILPLAYSEPSLLYSVLAFAAEHMSKRATDDNPLQLSRQVDASRFRDKSLKLLASHLKHEMQGQHQGQQLQSNGPSLEKSNSAKTILATMIMLCQLEMVHSESLAWKIHLQASHTMIQRWLLQPSRLDLNDSGNKFLIKETFTINVFAATSSFSDDEEALAFSDTDDHTLFSGFMTVIDDITRTERKIAAKTINFAPDLPLLERRLEQARQQTQILAANYDKLRKPETRKDFERVIDIYHHAGIIYAYQALAMPELARREKDPHISQLLQALHILPASGLFAQDLAWPLFIASTECRERERARKWLQQKMEDSADATGFASCHEAWDFLQKWWDMEEDARYCGSWIGFARARAARGHTFLVI